MKKLLCALLLMMLLCGAAQAQGRLITGDIAWPQGAAELNLHWGAAGFEGALTGEKTVALAGAWQPDGRLLIAADQTLALLLPALPTGTLTAPLLEALEGLDAYQTARHSSLFIQAQQVQFSADAVCAYARELLTLYPLLDADGSLRAALELAGGSETWATVTRYMADQQQYPGSWLLQINVDAPVLPSIFVEVQTGGKDSWDWKFAIQRQRVTDWDETIAALEEGGSADGFLLKGFAIAFEDAAETDTYVEGSLFWQGRRYTLELDCYTSNTGAYDWKAEGALSDDSGTELLRLNLESALTDAEPTPSVTYTRLVDLTDGVDAEEMKALEW